jgi:hypothetical protein
MALRSARLTYPKEYSDIGQYVVFTQKPHNKDNPIAVIAIAAPSGFTIADGAGYGNIDLGIIGTAQFDGKSGKDLTDAVNGTVKNPDDAKFITQSVLANRGIGGNVSTQLAAQSGASKGKAFNPNTVVQFNNMNLRTYQFQFVAVPSSADEWQQLKAIIDAFRLSMYPDKIEGSILLNYPDKWRFSFESEAGNQVPSSFTCYLTDMSTSYNSLGNAWHKDGAPTDVAITLAFQEVKALAKSDITSLNSGY